MASAPAWANSCLPLVEAGQAERRRVGPEMADRVRVEGGDDHRPPLVRAALHRAPDDRLVAEMEAVEIAERHHGAAQGARGSAGRGSGAASFRALSERPADCKCRHLNSDGPESYMALIPFTGLPAAHSCARRLCLWQAG